MSADASLTSDSPASRYLNLIRRLAGSGQWERALEVARDWLGEDPASAQAHLSAGQSLIHLKQYPQPGSICSSRWRATRATDFTHRLLSIACFHLGEHGRADDHIQQAISLNPNDPTHWYHLAWMRYKGGALEAAAKHARRSLELQPDDPNTLNLLALCEGKRGPEQLRQYLRALELDPENESIHNNIGTYYLDVDRNYPAAEECFRRALMFDPANKTAQKNLFLVLRKRDPTLPRLQFPGVMVDRLRWGNSRHGMIATRLGLVALWLVLGRLLLVILVLWLLFVYPLIKVYEYLTLGDIHARAGLARRAAGRCLRFPAVAVRRAVRDFRGPVRCVLGRGVSFSCATS